MQSGQSTGSLGSFWAFSCHAHEPDTGSSSRRADAAGPRSFACSQNMRPSQAIPA